MHYARYPEDVSVRSTKTDNEKKRLYLLAMNKDVLPFGEFLRNEITSTVEVGSDVH